MKYIVWPIIEAAQELIVNSYNAIDWKLVLDYIVIFSLPVYTLFIIVLIFGFNLYAWFKDFGGIK